MYVSVAGNGILFIFKLFGYVIKADDRVDI